MALVLSDPGDEANSEAVVTATFDDGTQARVLTSDEGELSFTPGEFVGLTQGEVDELFIRQDIASLRS